MPDKKGADNILVERVTGMEGHIDVSFSQESGFAIIGALQKTGTPYVEMELGGVPYIDDLIGALQRVKKKAEKWES